MEARALMPSRGVFVTGTDTGIGKTVVSACLVKAWGGDYWKPMQTGLDDDEGDTATVARLTGVATERLHPPAYAFGPPLSPHVAASQAGIEIELARLELPVSPRPIVVEGAGGAMVPLNDRALMIDLMVRLALPVVIAAADRLGAISQTLLTLEALRGRHLDVLGVILTGGPFADNADAIQRHGRVEILARLPWGEQVDAATIDQWVKASPRLATLPL